MLPLWLEVGARILRLGNVMKTFLLGWLDYIKQIIYIEIVCLALLST